MKRFATLLTAAAVGLSFLTACSGHGKPGPSGESGGAPSVSGPTAGTTAAQTDTQTGNTAGTSGGTEQTAGGTTATKGRPRPPVTAAPPTAPRPVPDFSDITIGAKTYTPSKNPGFALDGYKGKKGLYQNGGKVMYKGKEFHGLGANYMDGFIQPFETGNIDSERVADHFKILKANNIPYVRVNMSQFWPHLYEKYEDEKDEYFYVMDRFVRAAEEVGIGIIGTLFWSPDGLAQYCGEPVSEFGNPKSKIRAFMKQYIREVVPRYKNSPAIWIWEFSNEFNLYCDIPGQDARLAISTDAMARAMKAFAVEVRGYDKERMLTNGNSSTREAAYGMYQAGGKAWGSLDNVENMKKILGLQNPKELELISIHTYHDEPRGTPELAKADGYIKQAKAEADRLNRPFYIGEYAGDPTHFGQEKTKSQFFQVYNALRSNNIPLSTVWAAWYNTGRIEDCIMANPDMHYILETLKKGNQELFAKYGISIWK